MFISFENARPSGGRELRSMSASKLETRGAHADECERAASFGYEFRELGDAEKFVRALGVLEVTTTQRCCEHFRSCAPMSVIM